MEDDGNPEPDDDVAAEKGAVEGGHLAWILSVVVWEAYESEKPYDE